MLILDSGILLALSLSCGYNFEVWEVEPPCTRVKAETGDKALTSWWAVKLGRFQLRKKCEKFVSSGCSSYFGFNATLVAVVFSCYVGLSPHLDKNQDYFTDFWKKIPFRPIPIKCCLVLIKSTPDIVYGIARENYAVDLLSHQKQGKTIPVIASTLPKMHSKVSLDILACLLSLNPLRESIQLLLWKKG